MRGWVAGAGIGVGIVAAVACGGSDSTSINGGDGGASSGTTPPGTPPSAAWANVCDQAAARAVQCEAGAFDRAACDQDAKCFSQVMRSEISGPYAQCYGSRPCNQSDDSCLNTAASPYANDPPYVAFRDACLARRTACSNSFADDFCGEAVVLASTYLAAWKACLDKPCTDIRSCFDDALGPDCANRH